MNTDALYNRAMGRSYSEKDLLKDVANGNRGEHPSVQSYGVQYETGRITDVPRHERQSGSVEIKTDEHTHTEWIEIAGQTVSELISLYEENELTKDDIDLSLTEVMAVIEEQEHETNESLSEEHPKFSAALDAWLERDETYAKASDDQESAAAKVDFYESLMSELTSEKETYEQELGYWLSYNENQARKDELIAGIAQYNEFITLADHKRIEALAGIYKEQIQRLYDLAA